jgi:hypothetical protein
VPSDGERERTISVRVVGWTTSDVPGGFGDEATFSVSDSVATLTYRYESEIEDDRVYRAEWNVKRGSGKVRRASAFEGEVTCCWGARPAYLSVGCR